MNFLNWFSELNAELKATLFLIVAGLLVGLYHIVSSLTKVGGSSSLKQASEPAKSELSMFLDDEHARAASHQLREPTECMTNKAVMLGTDSGFYYDQSAEVGVKPQLCVDVDSDN